MRKAIVSIEGAAPLSWSRYLNYEKEEGEDNRDMEERIWQDRFHADAKGQLIVPPMAIKNSLVDVAQYLGEKIEGQGNKTWTDKFRAGILVFDPMGLGVTKKDLEPEWVLVPGSPGKGKRGTGPRVEKCFPRLLQWSGEIVVYLADEIITQKKFDEYLKAVGQFVGWGRFRVINGGYYGRFLSGKSVISKVTI